MDQQNKPKRLAPKAARPRAGRWILVILVVLAALYLGLCTFASSRTTLFPGLTAAGVELGGMHADQAVQALTGVPLPEDTPLSVSVVSGDETLAQDTALSFRELGGVELDPAATVQRAADYCQEAPFPLSGWRYLSCALTGGNLQPVLAAPHLADQLETLSSTLSLPVVHGGYTLTPEAISFTVPRDGYTVTAQTLETALHSWLTQPQAVLTCSADTVSAQALDLDAIAEDLSQEMKNAGYDPKADVLYPERAHAKFDLEQARTKVAETAPGETVTLPATVQIPTVTEAQLKATLFRDVLGQCTTHVGGSKGRKTNVRLSAEAINGMVLNCGDVFSYNEVVGQRTAARGYQPAPAYVKGQTVNEIGGGICQTSSTLYLACLRANLEIVARYAHRYIPAYIPAGMDATVSWGGPEYKFRNNMDHPIRIETSYQNGDLTVRILGTNVDGTHVKITNQFLSTTPYEVIVEEDPSLAPGQEVVKVTPYTGYKYQTFRHVYDAQGKLLSSAPEATSHYKPRNKVIAKGPVPQVQPEPPKETVPETPEDPTAPVPDQVVPEISLPEAPPGA